jgi:D-amino-acid dehydrogenase
VKKGNSSAVVVGGGVIGAATAYYLTEQNWEVTLIDQQQFGSGCSHGNCGYVSPSHVLPLAGPGVLWPTLRTLFARNSPLKIRVRFDPALWMWLAKFALKCNERDRLAAARGIATLLNSSRDLYDQLFQQEPFHCDWETRGLLFVFRSEHGMEHYAEVDRLLRTDYAMPAVRYDGSALTDLEPALKAGCAGAWLYPRDAHLRPDLLMESWRRVLEQRGVTIREGCQFLEFGTHGQRVTSVETTGGSHACDAVVVATGAWTPQLARQLKCSIPIVPGKGYSMTMPRPQKCPIYPMIFEEHRVAITPFSHGYRIGSTMEFAGYDSSLNPQRLSLLREGAALYLHEPMAEPLQEEWSGWRPMIYDGLPVIDFTPAYGNVLIAAGHGMLGVSMSPGTGKLAAELLSGATPHIDARPYSAVRF